LKKNENKIYVLKWSDMCKTLKDDDVDISDEENDEDGKDPVMRYESIPHKGCINRIRSLHGSGVVATWSDENEVGIYDVTQAVEAVDIPTGGQGKKSYSGTKLASFKHSDEGYALDWSPLTLGRLASGGCNAQIWLYQAKDENCSSLVKESSAGLQGHKKSVEDLQFSPA
jgi:ribosome assembly protein RRB1